MTLKEFFTQIPKAALAFSGGTDSAYLLAQGLKLGADLRPYYMKTALQPAFELEDARRLCQQLGVELTVVELDLLALPEIRENGPERCYYCKKTLFSTLQERAAADGYPVVLDGTNTSDDPDDRPGMSALEELGVRSPLRECGLTKGEIRLRSRQMGLFTWSKPAYACLATRIPTGTPIEESDLNRVERAEAVLARLGFSDFRVRLFRGCARLQLPREQQVQALEKRDQILSELEPLFDAVLLDLQVR